MLERDEASQRFALPAGGRVWIRLIIQKNAQAQNQLFLAGRIPPACPEPVEGSSARFVSRLHALSGLYWTLGFCDSG